MIATIGKLPKPIVEQPVEPIDDGHDVKRQTLYVPRGVHNQLREAAFTKRVSMQEIARQAFDKWFADNGLPSWDEAKRKGIGK